MNPASSPLQGALFLARRFIAGLSQISAQQYWTESDVGGGGGQIRMLS